ncbi:MAG TPA: hypothetical protein VFW70_03405 [Methylomirabilota bacterium]|nr:hypothetical protein [Methylomirabilota bacterium]
MIEPSRQATPPDRQTQVDVASLAGAIERMAGDLAIGEEPSNFAAVLEAGAPRD